MLAAFIRQSGMLVGKACGVVNLNDVRFGLGFFRFGRRSFRIAGRLVVGNRGCLRANKHGERQHENEDERYQFFH